MRLVVQLAAELSGLAVHLLLALDLAARAVEALSFISVAAGWLMCLNVCSMVARWPAVSLSMRWRPSRSCRCPRSYGWTPARSTAVLPGFGVVRFMNPGGGGRWERRRPGW